MPKLSPIHPLGLIKILEKIGFTEHMGRGSHRIMKHADGRRTTIPVHNREIPIGTLMAILRDCRLGKDDIEKFREGI